MFCEPEFSYDHWLAVVLILTGSEKRYQFKLYKKIDF